MSTAANRLSDRVDVVDTAISYATAIDTRDWALFAGLFTPDTVWDYRAGNERRTGPDDILARVRPSIENLDATQHFLTNHVVRVTGDTATHTCYFQAQHLRDGRHYLGAGRYEDELRRVDGSWRFAARVLISTWSEGDPDVFRSRSA